MRQMAEQAAARSIGGAYRTEHRIVVAQVSKQTQREVWQAHGDERTALTLKRNASPKSNHDANSIVVPTAT